MIGWTESLLAVWFATSAPEPAAEPFVASDLPKWTIRHDAAAERRSRITTGAAKVGAGALQAAMGLYVLLGVPTDAPGVDEAGILNTAAGGGLILDGVLALSRRGPLEALVRRREFDGLGDRPESETWLNAALSRAARRGRIERNVSGSLSLAAGLTIVGLGIANLAHDDLETQPGRAVLGASEVAAGIAFSSIGIRSLVIPSQAEHTFKAWTDERRLSSKRRASIRISLTWGGIYASGRF